MTPVKETRQGLIFCLLLVAVCTEEPEPVFRLEGDGIVMGYCFGVDYIVIYRSTPEGDQLLGNSSADAKYSPPPADLQGRVNLTSYQQLVGLQISDLRPSDAGVYRRECWQNNVLVNQQRQRLSVCDREVKSQGIAFMEDGGAELLCNSSSIGVEGATVQWYRDTLPSYKVTLLLDTDVSMTPLVEGLQGVVEVREGGAVLRVPGRVLQDSHHLYCVVMRAQTCLSFQSIHLPIRDDVEAVSASRGDRVVLKCLSRHENQWWETPLGNINTTSKSLTSTDGGADSDRMFLSDDGAGNVSLVIPTVSEKHGGEYSCYSPSLTGQYSLVICPRQEPQEKVSYEGGDVLLECKATEEEFSRLQWHRRGASGEDSLILDSRDKSLLVPEDLTGRVFPSEDGSSLRLSGLTKRDRGTYWCVALGGPEFLDDSDDYFAGGDGEADGDEYSDVQDWPETYRCISKQETTLTVAVNSNKDQGRGLGLEPDDPARPGTSPPSPPADPNLTAYAVGAVVVGLVVAGVVVVVIVIMKRRARASQKQGGAALGPGLKLNKDIEMSEDPGCRERLAPRGEDDD